MSEANGHAEDMEEKAIVKHTSSASTALEPRSVEEAFYLAQKLVASGLLGKSIQKPESALAVVLTGRELGLTAMQSLRSIHIIEGKPTLSADLMVALVKRSPACRYFKLVESTSKVAKYETYREGEGVTAMSFTIEQAQAAGVTGKDNWKKWPDAMLRARCIAALARAVYPDMLAGVYETDEIQPVETTPRRGKPSLVVADTIDVEFKSSEEETNDERIDRWMVEISATATEEDLVAVGKAIKAEQMPESVRLELSREYAARRKAIRGEVK